MSLRGVTATWQSRDGSLWFEYKSRDDERFSNNFRFSEHKKGVWTEVVWIPDCDPGLSTAVLRFRASKLSCYLGFAEVGVF